MTHEFRDAFLSERKTRQHFDVDRDHRPSRAPHTHERRADFHRLGDVFRVRVAPRGVAARAGRPPRAPPASKREVRSGIRRCIFRRDNPSRLRGGRGVRRRRRAGARPLGRRLGRSRRSRRAGDRLLRPFPQPPTRYHRWRVRDRRGVWSDKSSRSADRHLHRLSIRPLRGYQSVRGGKARNAGFVDAVRAAFPDPAIAKIIVSCSDGRQRAVAALDALEEAGYSNLVLLKGGFNLYNRHWTTKLNRRLPNGNFKTNLSAPGDIQGCGANPEAGNANDAIAFGPWVDDTDWKTALG